jgi:hypothetical protein
MKKSETVFCPHFYDRCYSADCTTFICQSQKVEQEKKAKRDAKKQPPIKPKP